MSVENKPERLNVYSLRMSAARQVARLLLDGGYFDYRKKEDTIYTKATIRYILSDMRAMEEFMATGGIGFRYRNHKKDKKGKLISAEAYCPSLERTSKK